MSQTADQVASRSAPGAEDRPGCQDRAPFVPRPGYAVALALVTVAAFLPVLDNGFVPNWDDQMNFLANPGYRGLGWANLRWAWSTVLLGVYQPLAWMLLEAQYVLWGSNPRGYHLASLLLHAANAVVLLKLTRALLCRVDRASGTPAGCRGAEPAAAALAVGLFAVHPLRVEVVAWASCQPYLPCALFAMLAILAYLRAGDAARPAVRVGWLVATWLFYVAALLCKAVAVPLPLVLLILDAYPLRRWRADAGRQGRWGPPALWREKLPFVAPMLAAIGLAIWARAHYVSMDPVDQATSSARLLRAIHGICFYAVKTVAPFGLNAFYPPQRGRSWGEGRVLIELLAVLGVSGAAYLLRRRLPGLPAAWACYLVCLAPNLGIVRVGTQDAADRYSYIASMAWVVVLAYGLGRLARRPGPWLCARVVGLGLLVGLAALSWRQCLTWRTPETLWTQAFLHGGRDDPVINTHLGVAQQEQGRTAEAREHFLRALRLAPESSITYVDLGSLLLDEGRLEEARAMYRRAIELKPNASEAMTGIGLVLMQEDRLEDAKLWFRRALRINPEDAVAHNNLGVVLMQLGNAEQGCAEFAAALHIHPAYVEVHNNLGWALLERGAVEAAAAHFAAATRLKPDYANAHAGLGTALSRRGRVREAAVEFAAALRINPDHTTARRGLADLRGR